MKYKNSLIKNPIRQGDSHKNNNRSFNRNSSSKKGKAGHA